MSDQPNWEEIPTYLKDMFPPGLSDMGSGKSMLEIDDAMIDACRESEEYCGEVYRRALALVENIKDNGGDFIGAWAAFMVLARKVQSISAHPYEMFAYVLARQVFDERQ